MAPVLRDLRSKVKQRQTGLTVGLAVVVSLVAAGGMMLVVVASVVLVENIVVLQSIVAAVGSVGEEMAEVAFPSGGGWVVRTVAVVAEEADVNTYSLVSAYLQETLVIRGFDHQ